MKIIHTFLEKLVLIRTMALLMALFISGTSAYADLVFVDQVSDSLNQQMHNQLKKIEQAIQLETYVWAQKLICASIE